MRYNAKQRPAWVFARMEGFIMQYVILLGGLLVLGSWLTVILHRLGHEAFNPVRYPIMETTLGIAYMVVAVSLCGLAGAVAIFLLRR